MKTAVIAPAGKLKPEKLKKGLELLRRTGEVMVMPHVEGPSEVAYLAAPARERAAELETAWLDPEVKELLCVRGGFGCAHLLPLIDWRKLAARQEQVLTGYSDVTALHWAMVSKGVGRPVAGPMVGTLPEAAKSAYTVELTRRMNSGESYEIPAAPEYGPLVTLKPGTASGPLLVGNLAVSVTLCGTGFLPDPAGRILLFEDLNEPAYKLDRYLTQLSQNGFFRRCAGLIFGQFTDCATPVELNALFSRFAAEVPGPVIGNFPFGHTYPIAPLQLNRRCRIEAGRIFME